MRRREQLTQAELKAALWYDPDTGTFYNVVARGARAQAGAIAGTRHSTGYWQIRLGGRIYLAHRLAFLYMTGEWPVAEVDHINGVHNDNRWVNLRDVSRACNVENQRRAHTRSKSGLLGASPHATMAGKWRASICSGRKVRNLGTFDTSEEAHAAYLKAKRELHEGCTI